MFAFDPIRDTVIFNVAHAANKYFFLNCLHTFRQAGNTRWAQAKR